MRALLLGLVVACGAGGSHASAPARLEPTPPSRHASEAVAEPTPGEGDCDALFAHAVTLAVAEQRARQPDRVAADDDQARARADLHARYGASCRAMTRAAYRCALAAASLPALDACGGAQATRTSSTSNSSVEPGGMTPGTPRSP